MNTTSHALSSQEQQTLDALMTDLEQSWRQRDIPRYLAHFSESADLVNRAGAWFKGKAHIEKQLLWLAEKGRPEMFSMKTTLEAIRTVARDVVILIQRRDETVRESLATYVVVQQDSRWRIESLSIAPLEARSALPAAS